jgi:hypothetical protein
MIAVVVDTSKLLKVAYSSVLAGVGVAAVFSLAIYGAARSAEMRRGHRGGAALGFATIAVLAAAVSGAAVVYGVVLVAQKG